VFTCVTHYSDKILVVPRNTAYSTHSKEFFS